MEIITGYLYFISDDYFAKVQDPYLKINYSSTKRPHYFAFQDKNTGLYWVVPCSSRVEKFEALIQKKRAQHKPADAVKIVTVLDKKSVLLFQDMFPITVNYIDSPYIKGGQHVRIADPKKVRELEKTALKILNLLHRGIRFTPTQADIIRIEKMMLEESTISSQTCTD